MRFFAAVFSSLTVLYQFLIKKPFDFFKRLLESQADQGREEQEEEQEGEQEEEGNPKPPPRDIFEDVPHTVQGHFVLHLYAAIYRLIRYIRHLGNGNEEELAKTFAHYPFLEGYFAEMCQYIPEGMTWDAALAWWETEITAWEQTNDVPLPLLALTEQAGMSLHGRIALFLVGLVEEDSRFGTLFARLQEPLASRRPSLELVGQIMLDNGLPGRTDGWSMYNPLISAGLLEVDNRPAPRSEWRLSVPTFTWDVIRGEVASHPTPWCQYSPSETFPDLHELIFPEEFLARLAEVPSLVAEGKAQAIVLRGMQGSERLQVMGAIARALHQGVVVVDGPAVEAEQHWERLGPFCAMTRSLPVVSYDLGPGETAEVPLLTGFRGPVGILIGFEGGLHGPAVEKAVALSLPMPKAAQRMRYWQEALAGTPVENLAEISERFQIPGGYIRQAASIAVAQAALEHRQEVRLGDIREALRLLNRQLLDTLATRLEVEDSRQLVVSQSTAAKLSELEHRCHHRERLFEHLGPAFNSGGNRGVRALFTGGSGTGKTLAAKILAAELGMDLYRVDLAAVVNKYIGETEKNLHRVLSRAEELDVILLLDEGDALLGKRTEVKSANDRYANLETNYLLQRLENYQGIVLITTNAGENIDTAFRRRMDVVVHFVGPQVQERWDIWQLHLPVNHAVDYDYLEEVAVRCSMNGGQIRNAALHATLLALEDGSDVVSRWHLEEAILSEYRKAGALFPLNESGRLEEQHGGVDAFLGTLLS